MVSANFKQLIVALILATLCVSAQSQTPGQNGADPIAVNPPQGKVPAHLVSLGNGNVTSQYAILADKSARTITVWKSGNAGVDFVAAYPMDIGKNSGDKVASGDHKTPEGLYFVQDKLDGPGLDFNEYGKRAFPLDYPNYFDKIVGKTGSGIWLHAIPETKSLLRGSRGCVVVRNEIIEKLTPLIKLQQTPVIILDKVIYVTPAELAADKDMAMRWLESWRQSWQSKNLDTYMTHYAESFSALKMNVNQWKRYKDALNKKYQYIQVRVEEPLVVRRGDEYVFHFSQDYDSDGLKDIGQKLLFAKATDKKLQIVTEIWRPLANRAVAAQENSSNQSTN